LGEEPFFEVDRSAPLDKMLYHTLDAKAHAEWVGGVGFGWDAQVLIQGKKKSFPVGKQLRSLIDSIFDVSNASPFDKKKQFPKDWEKRLSEWEKTLRFTSKSTGRKKP
jgi:hypothetical protein